MMIRILDIFISGLGLIFLSPMLLILATIGWIENRSPFFCQVRVGRHQLPFVLIKFRSMRPNTESIATHLVDVSAITPYGSFLRRTKVDEFPQLWNVLKGDMSLVGPRPCLFNQEQLISERAARHVFAVRPGITGLAQIMEIDMSTPRLLAIVDSRMIRALSLHNYFGYIMATALGKGKGDRVRKQ